ncbi:hypothetical protein BJY00DRAFT_311678 [Aspergillus carlsbadensis]|nr:hypothetical protein BJY00DRAFT_311678 [Aspergillus carlsbadensis]
MVYWKSFESQHRLVATILAANPGLKLNYPQMAAIYGQGATYDSIENQLRGHRKLGQELTKEAERQGISLLEVSRGRASAPTSTSATPRTLRTGCRGEVMKPSSSTKGKGTVSGSKAMGTPTKRGSRKDTSGSLIKAIYIDDEDDEDCCGEDDAFGVVVKSEDTSGCVLPSIEPPVFGLAGRIKVERESDDRDFEMHSDHHPRATSRATSRGKSRALQQDVNLDKEMAAAPAFNRITRESAPTRSLSSPKWCFW